MKYNLPPSGFESAGLPSPAPDQEYLYDLTGVVVHEGRGAGSGHYTAYCLNRVNRCWLHCNDTRVAVTSIDCVLKAQAYILFYAHRSVSEFVDGQLSAGLPEHGSAAGLSDQAPKRQRVEFFH